MTENYPPFNYKEGDVKGIATERVPAIMDKIGPELPYLAVALDTGICRGDQPKYR